MLAEGGADGLRVEGAEARALPGDDARAQGGIVDRAVGELGDRREVLLLEVEAGGPVIIGRVIDELGLAELGARAAGNGAGAA